MSLYQYRAQLIRVIDGDTLDLSIDLGFDITQKTRVRLMGINAPEMNTDAGKLAKAFVVDWFSEGEAITLETYKDKREKYGRYLAKVVTAKGDLAACLIEAGHAVAKEY